MLHGQFAKQLAGTFQHRLGHAREPRDVDAVAAVGAAFDDAVEEDDLVLPLAHGDVQVFHAGEAGREVGQLVVVRREERVALSRCWRRAR